MKRSVCLDMRGPHLDTVTLNTFSPFSQGSLSFIMKVHSKVYLLKITFKHQQGKPE